MSVSGCSIVMSGCGVSETCWYGESHTIIETLRKDYYYVNIQYFVFNARLIDSELHCTSLVAAFLYNCCELHANTENCMPMVSHSLHFFR